MNVTRLASTLFVSSALLCGCVTGVSGQAAEDVGQTHPGNGVVGGLGVGAGSMGVAGQLSLWAHVGNHAFGLRTAATFDAQIFAPSSSNEDYAVLYGRRSGLGRLWGRIGVGPSFVRTFRRGEPSDCVWFIFVACSYDTTRSSAIGLAVQADGILKLAGPVGLGMTVVGNLNPASSFAGVTLGLTIGHVGS